MGEKKDKANIYRCLEGFTQLIGVLKKDLEKSSLIELAESCISIGEMGRNIEIIGKNYNEIPEYSALVTRFDLVKAAYLTEIQKRDREL